MMESRIYSADFGAFRSTAIERLKEKPNDVPTRANYVRAQLLMGEVDLATEASKSLLTDVTLATGQTPQESRFMASHLVAVGEAAWLRRMFPLVASRTWQCRYSRHLKRPSRPRVKTFCINMDRDVTRLARARAMLAPGVDFHRSPGVSGVAVPEVLLHQAGRAGDGCAQGAGRLATCLTFARGSGFVMKCRMVNTALLPKTMRISPAAPALA